MSSNLKVLVADDNRDHIQLITKILNQELKAEVEGVTTGEECLKKVKKTRYDLLLLDYLFPKINGLDILKEIVEEGYDLPVIMITGHGSEKVAVEAMKAGAVDYIVKSEDGFQALPSVAKKAIEKNQLRKRLRQSEEKFKNLFESANDAIIYLDRTGRILEVNKQAVDVFGGSKEEVLGEHFTNLSISNLKDIPTLKSNFSNILSDKEKRLYLCIKNKKGKEITLECSASLMKTDDKVSGVMVIARDITERKRAEEALKKSAQLLRDTGEMAKVGGWELDLSTKEVSWTEEVGRIHGVEPGYKPKLEEALNFYAPESRPALEEVLKKATETGEPYDLESLFIPSGSKDKIWVRSLGRAVYSGGKIVKLTGTFQNIDKYKRAEEALRESEERYRLLADNVSDVIWTMDLNFKFTYFSPSIKQTLGYTPEEIISKRPDEVLTPVSYELVKKLIAEEMEIEMKGQGDLLRSRTVELEEVRKDGTTLWVEIKTSFLRDANNKAIGILGITRDIDERKKSEQQIRYQANLLDNVLDAIISTDINFNIKSWNKGAEAMYGWREDEVIDKSTIDVLKTEYPFNQREQVIKHLFEKEYWKGEITRKRKDGTVIYLLVSTSLIKDNTGNPVGFVAINRDITERKQAEQALKEREEKYKFLYEENQAINIIIGMGGKILDINKSAVKLFGYDKKDLLGKDAIEFVVPEQREAIAEQLAQDLKGIQTPQVQVDIKGKEMIHTLLFTEGHGTIFEKGNPVGILISAIDITDKKKMEAQLIQTEKLAAVGTLAYGIAHEFNNILAGMLANAELGLVTRDSRQIKECFEIIADNSHRAASITNNLLAFARQKEARKKLIDITEPLRSVLAVTQRELEKLNIEIVEKFKSIPKIYGDAGQLSEVFLNMVTNARDAMREKGGVLTIQLEPYEDNIRIVFKDTGCGIPEEIKGNIFEPFVTSKGALGGSEIPGTGLGLFLSYGIIDGYQGKIEVESKVGKGTQFIISIPVSKNLPPLPVQEIKNEPSGEIERKLKILLVDDEETIVSGLKKFLESKGHQVTTSLRGKEGLRLFKKDKFELVLSDITMPDMDGIELIKKIKEQDQKTKVIVITGHIMREMEEKAKEAGADEFLIKPFKNEVLCLAISKLMTEI